MSTGAPETQAALCHCQMNLNKTLFSIYFCICEKVAQEDRFRLVDLEDFFK